MSSIDSLAEQLARLAPETPDEVPVIGLEQRRDQVERATEIARRWGAGLQLDLANAKAERRRTTTVLHAESGGRATLFHASGALAIRAGLDPFSEFFENDPGDVALTELTREWIDKLSLRELVPADDRLEFERLWRIKAAGADPNERLSAPILCRAVGAFRHHVRDLPVLGRASAHVEVTGQGNLAAASLTLRRFAGSRDEVLSAVRPRDAYDAAREVAAKVARIVGGGRNGEVDGDLVPQMFAYGYVSLGRRRTQAVLAPMYVAAVSIVGRPGQIRSAHLVPVAGSEERFLKLPSGSGASTTARVA